MLLLLIIILQININFTRRHETGWCSVHMRVRLRLGQPVAAASKCLCGQSLSNGALALVCRRGVGKQVRHRLVNEFVRRAFQSAGLPVLLEPPGLSLRDGKRPDGVTVLPYTNGQALAWDATCVNPLAASYVGDASREQKTRWSWLKIESARNMKVS